MNHAHGVFGGVLLGGAGRIEAEADGFAALESLNCGKPINAMKGDESLAIVDCWRFFAAAVRCQHGSVAGEYLAGHTSMIRRDPAGTVASIAPSNYPLMNDGLEARHGRSPAATPSSSSPPSRPRSPRSGSRAVLPTSSPPGL